MIASTPESHSWSPWYRFDDELAKTAVPNKPGVCEVRTDFEFGRLKGSSSLVTIGSAVPSLKTRLYKQRFRNMARYLNRAEKWLVQQVHTLEFRYYPTTTAEEARRLEAERLIEYEYELGELPPGNEVLPLSVIKKEIEQKYGGKPAKETLRDLLRQNRMLDEVSRLLGTTQEIIHSLTIFWVIK
jgi:hypothetical protein